MKTIVLLLIILLFTSCNDYNYRVTDLEKRKINFLDLPEKVRTFIKNPSEFQNDEKVLLELVCLNENCNFKIETIKTKFGSWIAYKKLMDIDNEISYRIEQGRPFPYIIYNNRLYITNQYNLLFTKKDYKKFDFIVYILK